MTALEERFRELVEIMLRERISDLHLSFSRQMKIEGRCGRDFVKIRVRENDEQLLNYLQYLANLDLSEQSLPQSGAFELSQGGQTYSFRFAYLNAFGSRSGVLRIMNFQNALPLEQLVLKGQQRSIFRKWARAENGMIIISGPTGAGKTTSAYSLLGTMSGRKIYTLEDPVEVYHREYVQIQVNPQIGLDYASGIRELMRHDPDVILIGEIRDEKTAHMVLRGALTGHLVISTIHAANCRQAIRRLQDLGIAAADLEDNLAGLANQRLVRLSRHERRASIYEIFEQKDIRGYLRHEDVRLPSLSEEIAYAYQKRWIDLEEAKQNII